MDNGSATAIVAGVGGFVGMAGALGYGFKALVDVVSAQLKTQNAVIKNLQDDLSNKLDSHIEECRECRECIRRAQYEGHRI